MGIDEPSKDHPFLMGSTRDLGDSSVMGLPGGISNALSSKTVFSYSTSSILVLLDSLVVEKDFFTPFAPGIRILTRYGNKGHNYGATKDLKRYCSISLGFS